MSKALGGAQSRSFSRMEKLANIICQVLKVRGVRISVLKVVDGGLETLIEVGEDNGPRRPVIMANELFCLTRGMLRTFDVASDQRKVSCLSVAVRDDRNRVVGVLTVTDSYPRVFTADEEDFLQDISHVISLKIELLETIAIAEKEHRVLEAIFNNAPIGIAVDSEHGCRLAVNKNLCNMLGHGKSALIGARATDFVHQNDRDVWNNALSDLANEAKDHNQREVRLLKADGEWAWFRWTVSAMRSKDIDGIATIHVFEDIHEHKQHQEVRNLLLGELNHRVKNTLAVVQGIAKQLLRFSHSAEHFKQSFDARIRSLAQSHDMLTREGWQPLSLAKVIDDVQSGVWRVYSPRVKVQTVDANLNAQTTIMLSLLLNELMTNAVKHGALNGSEGHVEIVSSLRDVEEELWLDLDWKETTAEPIGTPKSAGLGLYLLERGPVLGLGGEGSVSFEPTGLHCRFSFPVYRDAGLFRVAH